LRDTPNPSEEHVEFGRAGEEAVEVLEREALGGRPDVWTHVQTYLNDDPCGVNRPE
jgi:hypothetical protein